MAERPKDLSQNELDALLDLLVQQGKEDTPEFARAYDEWERRDT